jgi:hypothetical protein
MHTGSQGKNFRAKGHIAREKRIFTSGSRLFRRTVNSKQEALFLESSRGVSVK